MIWEFWFEGKKEIGGTVTNVFHTQNNNVFYTSFLPVGTTEQTNTQWKSVDKNNVCCKKTSVDQSGCNDCQADSRVTDTENNSEKGW